MLGPFRVASHTAPDAEPNLHSACRRVTAAKSEPFPVFDVTHDPLSQRHQLARRR